MTKTCVLYRVRYTPGSDLAKRFPEPTATVMTRDEWEPILRAATNGAIMELVPA